jgi:hypothetical protein
VAQPGKQLVDRLDDQNRTIAILDIGGVHLGTDQQTAGVGHNVSLAPFDLLGRIPRVAALPRPRTGSSSRPAAFSRLDRLTVDHSRRRARVAAYRFACCSSK